MKSKQTPVNDIACIKTPEYCVDWLVSSQWCGGGNGDLYHYDVVMRNEQMQVSLKARLIMKISSQVCSLR